MKQLVIVLISGYQQLLSPLLGQLLGSKTICRYELSCSAYTKQQVQTHGVSRGLLLGIKRILSCSPYYSYDRTL